MLLSMYGFCGFFGLIFYYIGLSDCSGYYNHFTSTVIFSIICDITYLHLFLLSSKKKGSAWDSPECQGCCGKVYDDYHLSFCFPVLFYSTNITNQFYAITRSSSSQITPWVGGFFVKRHNNSGDLNIFNAI